MSDSLYPDRREFLLELLSLTAASSTLAAGAAAPQSPSLEKEATAYLSTLLARVLPMDTAAAEAGFLAATDISDTHTEQSIQASQAVKVVVGSPEVIQTTKRFLARRQELTDATARQLHRLLLWASNAPGTIPDVVKLRTEAEARQSKLQDEFEPGLQVPGAAVVPLSVNDIDGALGESTILPVRRALWESSKAVGGALRDSLLKLRDLRNKVAREMGYESFFALQVADYGMTATEMIALTRGFVEDVRPLYEQVHAWARYRLAERYGVDAPAAHIPAHWLNNRWAQNWPGLVDGIDLDQPFKQKTPEFLVKQAEQFYVSLGFPELPASFWQKSDLYPAQGSRKKNSHATAYQIDWNRDVRCVMSVVPNSYWFETAHHELGHIYYYLAYSRPEVPILLRDGANRAFHEGIGDLIKFASGQRAYRKKIGLLPAGAESVDSVNWLLDAACNGWSVVFVPFAAGLMTEFEYAFYNGTIADDQLNAAWWNLAGRYQGIAPPAPRPETLCDAATKTHINDDPAQYYDYAIGNVMKFQLHDRICRNILKQDPRNCDYSGSKATGDFLESIFRQGATRDWNVVLRDATGEGLSAKALVRYFEPLRPWLAEQNQKRKVGWG